jgi:LysM repeat protein
MPRTSLLVTVLVVMAASASLLAGALFFGFLTVPGGGVANQSPRPSGVATPSTSSESQLPTAGPSSTPSAAPTPGPTAGGTHEVGPGESLSTIGELYGVAWLEIAEANGIPEPYVIQVGQVLIIPIGAEPTSEAGIHVVAPGESIISIAELYDLDPTVLADANDIEDWNLIFVGQRLIIPDGSTTAAPSATP